MIELNFREAIHPGYADVLKTPRTPALLTIVDNITLTFSDLFVGGQTADIDRSMHDLMLSHPILIVGGSITARVHVAVTLKPLQGGRHAIMALNYFLPYTGWHPMIADGAFLIPEHEPDPDWLCEGGTAEQAPKPI